MSVMVFEVGTFLGMKKGYINEMQTFRVISKEMQQMWVVKLSVIWSYQFLFFICKLKIF